MSQQSGSPFATQTIFAQPQQPSSGSNGLGIAGFIMSLLGLLTSCCMCFVPWLGLLSVVGLVLSFIAVFRKPRGLAITGIILGAIGVIILLLALLVHGMANSVGGVMQFGKALGTGQAIADYRNANGSYPADLTAIHGQFPQEATLDKWGNAFVYEVSADGTKFTIRSMGEDGVDRTADDVLFNKEWFQDPGFTREPIPQDELLQPEMPTDAPMDSDEEAPGPG
ncbi:MAG TPA: type II secretion system protein GspG [Phycisphaerales bacterium]|nr:type II secretion system protein GspG [Phycisphaerales bacterium]